MEALKGSSPHGDGSSWRWSEGQGRWTSLPSPQVMGHTETIDERGSFLEPINSFKLDSEPASTMDSPLRGAPIPPTRVPPAGYAMARQESAELTNTIQSAFDEMDAALASRPPQHLPVTRVSAPNPMGAHPTSLNAHAPTFTPLALREQRSGGSPWCEPEVYRRFDRVGRSSACSEASESSPAEGAPYGITPQWGTPHASTMASMGSMASMASMGSMASLASVGSVGSMASMAWVTSTPPPGMEPTEEEQTWLDAHLDAVDDAAVMDAEADREESWVRKQMQQHPGLAEEDARALYECSESPDVYAMDEGG